jgi:hypothetical protein
MAERAPETELRETPPPVEPHIEDSISGQWAETNPVLWFVVMLEAAVWSALWGRKTTSRRLPHSVPLAARQGRC